MSLIYKDLMVQHGGYIPFSKLIGGYQTKTKQQKKTWNKRRRNNRALNKKSRNVRGGNKKTRKLTRLPTKGYSIGTILRNKGVLYKLNSFKRWIKI